MAEYPIIDGIPIIVADVRGFVSRSASALLARTDLSDTLESLVGDCCGPQSDFDVSRQHVGSYAYDHYGDLDPEEKRDGPAPPGSILRLLKEGLDLAGNLPAGPALDLGCAVGRTSFALAESTDDLVLGVDLNLDMLRTASRALHDGIVRYPRRRIGMVYDRREFPVSFPGADRVDLWACDAGAIPTAPRAFGTVVSLNLLDCMNHPLDHLREIARILAPGGCAILSTPYDWSPNATPVEAWIGGHSQRSVFRGAAEPLLRHLLSQEEFRGADGLEIVSETSVPWSVRVHDRAAMTYQSHLMILRKGAD
jgi:SAM-dependent methyltransferase